MSEDARDGSPKSETTTSEITAVSEAMLPVRPPLNTARARLVMLRGTQIGRRYPLDAISTLGRGGDCTVPLDDSMASRRHANITRQPDGSWEVVDLGSRNGILVNERQVTRAYVGPGDRIQIGESVLLFTHVDALEDQIMQRERLEALGRLSAGIAHDINNILGGVLMNAEFLLAEGSTRPLGDPAIQASLADLRASSLLGAELTKRILRLAQRTSGEHAQIDLSALVSEALDLSRRMFAQGVKIERVLAPHVHVRGDRGPLHQVLMNLLLNARDAMPDGGTVRVRLAHSTVGEVDSQVAVAGQHATLFIEDTGFGMDEPTRARIFEPFFTTKTMGRGSGLGLATVHEIVIAHGGTVTCESEVGKGSRFRVVLPALAAAARPDTHTPIATPRIPRAVRRATILVVDDEPLSLRSLCRLLSRDGHEVLSAQNGKEAVEVLAKRPSGIDLVVMDLDMPELDGEQAFLRMRNIDPAVRVVFLTGFVETRRRDELLQIGAAAVLMKPCPAAGLRDTIERALAPVGARLPLGRPSET